VSTTPDPRVDDKRNTRAVETELDSYLATRVAIEPTLNLRRPAPYHLARWW
jgi:hypothetical protein